MTYLYYKTNSTNPFWNLAFEEYLLKHKSKGDLLMLWQNRPTVVCGINQVVQKEVNLSYLQEKDISLIRRSTGGGAVYHDLGNLNYSFITDASTPDQLDIRIFSRRIVQALKTLGIEAYVEGRNDVLADGKKVSGVAQRMENRRVLHHGTLLFDVDLSVMEQVLSGDKVRIETKGDSSIQKRVTNLKTYLPNWTLTDFWKGILSGITDGDYEECYLSEEELKIVQQLQVEKYENWSWTFGRNPSYRFHNQGKTKAGTIHVSLDIQDGMIQEIGFYGDYLGTGADETLVAALKGVCYTHKNVADVLQQIDFKSVFGEVSIEVLTQLIAPPENT